MDKDPKPFPPQLQAEPDALRLELRLIVREAAEGRAPKLAALLMASLPGIPEVEEEAAVASPVPKASWLH